MIVRTLKWPVISLLIIGTAHLIEEALWPDLQTFYLSSVVGMILLVVGLWTGYLAVHNGGSYITAIAAGVILGVLPPLLDLVGFGMILGRGVSHGLVAGVFGLSMVLIGSIVGGGYAVSTGGHRV